MITEFYISFNPNLQRKNMGRSAAISEAMSAIEFDYPDTSDP